MINMVKVEKHIYHVQVQFESDGRVYAPGYYHANECGSVEGPFASIMIAQMAMRDYFKALDR